MCSACDRDPVRWFQEALEVREAIGEPKGLRLAVHNLGGALMLWRKPVEARPVLERGLEIARALQDLEAQRRAHVNLASCLAMQADEQHVEPWHHETTGLRAEAHAHLEQAIALATQLGLDPAQTCSGLVSETWYLCQER
jgi:hypothetical protein